MTEQSSEAKMRPGSDLLSGLPTVTMPVYAKDERGDFYPMTNAITWVKRDDVAEALGNPTDEQVERLAASAWAAIDEWRPAHEDLWELVVRAVLAAAAGGGDD